MIRESTKAGVRFATSRVVVSDVGSLRRRGAAPPTLFLIPLLTEFSGLLLVFTVSRQLAEQGTSLLAMGLIGAGYALGLSASSFLFGGVSDKLGRKPVMIPGGLLLLASIVLCLWLPFGSAAFLAMYWCNALALGLIYPPTIAWFNQGEAKTNHSSVVSGNLIRFCLSWNIGVMAAQLSGGWLFGVDARFPLFVVAGAATLDLLMVLAVGRRAATGPAVGGQPAIGPTTERWSVADRPAVVAEPSLAPAPDPSPIFVRLGWIANLGSAFCISMILHLMPRLAVALGVSPEQHGTILGLMRVVAITVYFILHATTFWRYRFAANLAAQAFAVGGLLAIYFARGPIGLGVGVLGLAVMTGFTYFSSIYYSSAGHGDDRRGYAAGMHLGTLGLGIAAGSASGGLLGALAGDRVPYLLAMGVLLVLTVTQTAVYLGGRGRRVALPTPHDLDDSPTAAQGPAY